MNFENKRVRDLEPEVGNEGASGLVPRQTHGASTPETGGRASHGCKHLRHNDFILKAVFNAVKRPLINFPNGPA